MKKLPCKNPDCGKRRVHHEKPDEPRGVQYVEVPDTSEDCAPVFCSISCACMDGWMTVKYETREQEDARRKAWREKEARRWRNVLGGGA